MKNLYLEKLKRMNAEQLLEEVEKHGRVMERNHPMTPEDKSRAYMTFRFAHARGNLNEDDRRMLEVAIRVLRLL